MLLDSPEVMTLLKELRQEFDAIELHKLYPAYLERFNSVTEWKFSSGDYFAPIPYESERMGFSPDVLIKKKYKNVDEARWLGKYCAGFVRDQHVLTIRPGKKSVNALSADLYDEVGSALKIRSVSFKWIGKAEKLHPAITGLSLIISKPDRTKLDVGVGISGAFLVSLYQYSDQGVPIKVQEFANGWANEAEWEYHYTPDGQLEQIFAGGPVPVWRRR